MGRLRREPCPTCGKRVYSYETWVEYEGEIYHALHVPPDFWLSDEDEEG